MLIHASCAAKGDIGVLITGRSGSGKSNFLLRLISAGFELVADDYVLLENGIAQAPPALKGMIEVRGLGIYVLECRDRVKVCLVVEAGSGSERVAFPRCCPHTGQPAITLDLMSLVGPEVVKLAVACLEGQIRQVAGPL